MNTGKTYILGLILMQLVPLSAKAQWSFDIGTVEAYINDHKQQRSLCWPAPHWNTATNSCTNTAVRRLSVTRS